MSELTIEVEPGVRIVQYSHGWKIVQTVGKVERISYYGNLSQVGRSLLEGRHSSILNGLSAPGLRDLVDAIDRAGDKIADAVGEAAVLEAMRRVRRRGRSRG